MTPSPYTLNHQNFPQLNYSLISSIHSSSSSYFLNSKPEKKKKKKEQLKIKMALQVQATLHTTRSSLPSLSSPNPLRSPSNQFAQFALKSSFLSRSLNLSYQQQQQQQQQSLVYGPPKITMRVASKQAYICRDCGYIYNDKTPFDKLPDKYFCPVCGAPKRRFKPYATDVSKKANETDVRKARKAELQRDEAVGKALPIAVAVGVVALAGLYFYLNNTF